MRLVNPVDQIFLRLERRNQPMHVGGLQLFTLPAHAGESYIRDLVARIRSFTEVQPPFDRRLKYRLGVPFWIDDHAFDLEFHVRHLALPSPGEIRDLLALISMLHSALLDRSRPLWEVYVIEGVTGDRFAVYSKFHHALMDGVSAMRVMRGALSDAPDSGEFSVPWQLLHPTATRDANRGLAGAWHAAQATIQELTALPGAGLALYRSWQDADDPDYTSIIQAPRTMLNRRVSGSRRFAAQSYSLIRIKRLAHYYKATVNDLVLAMCASALRRYLSENDALPTRPLVAMLPVSLHDDNEVGTGNRIAMIFASLATDVSEPVERLDRIRRSVNYWKRRYRHMTSQQIMAFIAARSVPAGLNLLTGAAPHWQSFNVVISNVPGPDKTLYFGGAELTGMYPVSIVLDGQALNISFASYRDSLEFGLTACRRSLPSMQNLIRYLADALDELEPDDEADIAARASKPPRKT